MLFRAIQIIYRFSSPHLVDSILIAKGFGPKSYEANQPPLYYALLALLIY